MWQAWWCAITQVLFGDGMKQSQLNREMWAKESVLPRQSDKIKNPVLDGSGTEQYNI